MIIKTEKYYRNILLYFIYILSIFYNFIFLLLINRVNIITEIIFFILFIVSLFYCIFTYFLNFKIKRVLFHRILLEQECMKIYDTFPKIGIKIPKEQVVYFKDVLKCEAGEMTYKRKKNKLFRFPFYLRGKELDLRDNTFNINNYFVIRMKDSSEKCVRYFNCYSKEDQREIIKKIGIEKCSDWKYLFPKSR